MRVILIALLIISCLSVLKHDTNTLWPRPTSYTYDDANSSMTVSPCQINYIIEAADKVYIQEIIAIYLIEAFGCTSSEKGKSSLTISVANRGQFVAT